MDTNSNEEVRADIYLLISNLFRQAPTPEVLQFLIQLDIEDGNSAMSQAWEELRDAAVKAEADQEALVDEYQNLFIGVGRGEVIPFASWHLTGSLMEKPLADLRVELSQLGFERAENIKEPEDHISALCEVMAMLSERGDTVQQCFFNRHIEPWYKSFTEQINNANNSHFYLAVVMLCDAFLMVEATNFSKKRT